MSKTLVVNHIYECYPLYFTLFGRSRHVKVYDAMTAVIAFENWRHERGIKKLKVLELFAGQSEHKEHFIGQFSDPAVIQRYDCLDLHITDPAAGVVQGDALTFDYREYNAVLAFYFSLAATFVQDQTKHPRRQLDAFTRQAASTLKKGSAFFLHLGQLDHVGSLAHPVKDEVEEIDLWPGHPLLCHFGVADDSGTVTLEKETSYDRYTGCTYDHFKRIELRTSRRLIAKISIKDPFVQRFWTEPEVVDSLMLAGFSDIDFYHNELTYEDGPYERLSRTLRYPDCPSAKDFDDAEDCYVATELLAIK